MTLGVSDETLQVFLSGKLLSSRYFSRIPPVPDMSDEVTKRNRDLPCSTTDPSSTRHHSIAPAPLHTFDSSRYHVSLQHRDHPIASPPKLTSTYILAEEHRDPTLGVMPSGLSGTEDVDLHFQLEEIFDASMLDFLQVVFLVVDAVLLLYRVSCIYAACQELNSVDSGLRAGLPTRAGQLSANGAAMKGILRHRHPHDVEGLSDGPGRELVRQLIFSEGQDIPVSSSEETDCHGMLDTRLTRITEFDLSRSCSQAPSPGSNCNRPVLNRSVVGAPSSYPSLKPVLETLALHCALPRILASVLLVALVCLCARHSLDVLDVARLRDWNVLASYVDVVQLRVNETNAYLEQHAEHLNDVIVGDCRVQATTELLNLQSLIEHFSIGNLLILEFHFSPV